MSKPWSDNPNAPRISHGLYVAEKINFVGSSVIGTILYGIIIALFFQCMNALLDPVNRRKGGIKWGLVLHTVAMFSFMTINATLNFDAQTLSFVDNRKYPGSHTSSPGPVGYQGHTYTKPVNIVSQIMFYFNLWLADGLLLYRCYIIYAKRIWVIAFPCLLFIASIVSSIMTIVQVTHPENSFLYYSISFALIWLPTSFALTVLVTLMVVVRLVLHGKNIQNAMGSSTKVGGLYKAIITMLVESYALYAISFVVYMGLWGADNYFQEIFAPIFAETQVITPFLVILRVANQSAMTSETIASGNIGSIHFNSHGGSTYGNEATSDEEAISSGVVDTPSEHDAGAKDDLEESPL